MFSAQYFQKPERRPVDEYRGDVIYDVWRAGGDVDAVDYDRVDDAFRDGESVESCTHNELDHQ